MTDSSKQTALFFGFLTAAMTCASAQAASAQPRPARAIAAEETAVRTVDKDRAFAARIERTRAER